MNTLIKYIKKFSNLAIRPHFHCEEDSFYSCHKHQEYMFHDEEYKNAECNCGADEHNAKINEIYKQILNNL